MNICNLNQPLSCDEVQRLIRVHAPAALDGTLDGEVCGKILGHVNTCKDCDETLWAHLGSMAIRGKLPLAAVRKPVRDETMTDLGSRFGVPRSPVESSGSGAGTAPVPHPLKEQFARLRLLIADSLAWWQMALMPPAHASVPTMGPVPDAPTSEAEPVQPLDGRWQAAGEERPARIERGPCIAPDGRLVLGIASHYPRLVGRRLIASLTLVEGEAIRFEVEPSIDGKHWEFAAVGLPHGKAEVRIPIGQLTLYAAARTDCEPGMADGSAQRPE